MLKFKTISPEDLDLMQLTDSPKEVLDIMVRHREKKSRLIKEAMNKKGKATASIILTKKGR